MSQGNGFTSNIVGSDPRFRGNFDLCGHQSPERGPPAVRSMRLMPLSPGETFAGFRIVRLHGSVGMGEVYLVQHPRLPRRDALKMLPADVSADAEYRARFNREADLASTLWHPHIVRVHESPLGCQPGAE
jgi:serine/threonine protein kinase